MYISNNLVRTLVILDDISKLDIRIMTKHLEFYGFKIFIAAKQWYVKVIFWDMTIL